MSNVPRYPLNGTFELTGRCNLTCQMCLVRVDQKRINELGYRERTAEEWISMAKQIAEAGTLNLLLTGGEVLLRPDFCEIYEAIAKMGFMLTVYTNATMVNDKVMELFRKYPPHKIGVTMYGACNETYEMLCGMKDGYDRFVAGLHQLMTLPSLLDIRTTIVKTNVQDLEAMQKFTEELFGDPTRLHISRFVCKAVRHGICHPEEVRLTPEENVRSTQSWIVQLADQISQNKYLQEAFMSSCKAKAVQKEYDGHYLFESCRAGINEYTITWAGHMYACELLTKGYTEPFEEGFEAAWERLPDLYPKAKKPEKCRNCEYAVVCETCPANRLVETGDWFGIPEYACQEAKLKYELLSKTGII